VSWPQLNGVLVRLPRLSARFLAGFVVSVLLGLLAGLLVEPHAGARSVAPEDASGSAGAGDSYYPLDGNGGYDVAHYDIHDTWRIRTGSLSGWTDVSAIATQSLSSFHLDLVLAVDSVTVDGRSATYTRDGVHELVVTPAVPLVPGQRFVVRVAYHGRPAGIGYGGEKPFFTVGHETMATNEPHIAPWWYPANDHPSDKATFDITVRVPAGRQVISNGRLVRHVVAGHWASWHWRMSRPMATYLAFFAAGGFRIERGVHDGLPWLDAVSLEYGKPAQLDALRLMRRSSGIVSWLQTQFGRYPFGSTGGLVTGIFTGFALENQGRPTYPFFGSGREARSTVVHELAHQWFGDEVSVQRWRDIWLNEGFATWAEWRYAETHGGERAQHRLQREYAARPASRPFWRLVVADPGPDHLFDAPVYDRGAMALQALRHRIGTTRFLRLLRTWAARHAYGNATVEQFESLAEQESGQQLDDFFTAWLHTGSRPARVDGSGLR